ncbi:MAG: Mn2+/Zn2+ ABC transporter ATP-bidning protein [Acidimicrobiaceae bacterium]|nr:Mn2+/Zn2+ ABC transporter ATP-bidning protein [Acidimicrobiaceae bacterium]|tara:strand:- start:1464 stop:2246 length:783 start_codon:yes stop_codon:yes gene_type:complete
MTISNPTISTTDLEVRYGNTVAVTDVNLSVPGSSLLSVIGPNGAGKSALLKAIAGTVEAHTGSVEVTGPSPSFVMQSTDVDSFLPISVRDVVSLSRYSNRGPFRRFRSDDHKAINEAIERLNLTHLAKKQLHEVSGGERQRTLVAQGLAQESDVLLLDEPINGLDIVSRDIILEMIADEVKRGRTVVITTHNLSDAARADQVLLLNNCPCCLGTPNDVLTEANLRVAFGEESIAVGEKIFLDDPHHAHTSSHDEDKIRSF